MPTGGHHYRVIQDSRLRLLGYDLDTLLHSAVRKMQKVVGRAISTGCRTNKMRKSTRKVQSTF